MEEEPISVPDTGEGGKLKMIVSLVKKCLGVKDIASMSVLLTAICILLTLYFQQETFPTRISSRTHSKPRVLALSR
jgi:hypothetical protein